MLSPTRRWSLAWSPWGAGSSHWSHQGQSRGVSDAEGSAVRSSNLNGQFLTRSQDFLEAVLDLDVSQELLQQISGADIVAYGAVIGACAKAPSQAFQSTIRWLPMSKLQGFLSRHHCITARNTACFLARVSCVACNKRGWRVADGSGPPVGADPRLSL